MGSVCFGSVACFELTRRQFFAVIQITGEQYAAVFHQEGSPGSKSASISMFNPNNACVAVNITSPNKPGAISVNKFIGRNETYSYGLDSTYVLDGSSADINKGNYSYR